MLKITFFAIWLMVAGLAKSSEISGVFTALSSITFKSGASSFNSFHPAVPSWSATIAYTIQGSLMNPGDTFTLTMPCVYKFTDSKTSIAISANEVTYATCNYFNGENIVAYSALQCTVSNSVNSKTFATGSLVVPFTFNVGNGGGSVDLTCANTFSTAGINTIAWTHGDVTLTSTADFNNGGPVYVDSTNPSQWNYDARALVNSPQLQQINLGGSCPNGLLEGTIGIEVSGASIDCSTVVLGTTNNFNPWYSPKDSTLVKPSSGAACSSSKYVVSYKDIPALNRVFLELYLNYQGKALTVKYTNDYKCMKSNSYIKYDKTKNFNPPVNGDGGSNGWIRYVTTQTWTGSTTAITTANTPRTTGGTQTVIVEVPIPTQTTTITSGCTSTTHVITVPIGQTATEIVKVPSSDCGVSSSPTATSSTISSSSDISSTSSSIISSTTSSIISSTTSSIISSSSEPESSTTSSIISSSSEPESSTTSSIISSSSEPESSTTSSIISSSSEPESSTTSSIISSSSEPESSTTSSIISSTTSSIISSSSEPESSTTSSIVPSSNEPESSTTSNIVSSSTSSESESSPTSSEPESSTKSILISSTTSSQHFTNWNTTSASGVSTSSLDSVTSTDTSSKTYTETVTLCSDRKCEKESSTIISSSNSEFETVLTETNHQTEIVTITSCSDNKCITFTSSSPESVYTDETTPFTTRDQETVSTTPKLDSHSTISLSTITPIASSSFSQGSTPTFDSLEGSGRRIALSGFSGILLLVSFLF